MWRAPAEILQFARQALVEGRVGVAVAQHHLLPVGVGACRIGAGIEHDQVVGRAAETPEPFQQIAPASPGLLLRGEERRALEADLEQIDQDGGGEHVVELADKTVLVDR